MLEEPSLCSRVTSDQSLGMEARERTQDLWMALPDGVDV